MIYYRIKNALGEYYQRTNTVGDAFFTFSPWDARPFDEKERALKMLNSLRGQGWRVHLVKVTWRPKALRHTPEQRAEIAAIGAVLRELATAAEEAGI